MRSLVLSSTAFPEKPSAAIFNGDHTALSHLMFWVDMSFHLLVAFGTLLPRTILVNRSEIDSRGWFSELDRLLLCYRLFAPHEKYDSCREEIAHLQQRRGVARRVKTHDLFPRILPVSRSEIDSRGEFLELDRGMGREYIGKVDYIDQARLCWDPRIWAQTHASGENHQISLLRSARSSSIFETVCGNYFTDTWQLKGPNLEIFCEPYKRSEPVTILQNRAKGEELFGGQQSGRSQFRDHGGHAPTNSSLPCFPHSHSCMRS
jgi:hypothetical protein